MSNNKQNHHNVIPFINLDLRKAREEDFSPYAVMVNSLNGYLVFNRESCEKILKHELWALYHNKSRDRKKIMERTHKKYVFISRNQWETM